MPHFAHFIRFRRQIRRIGRRLTNSNLSFSAKKQDRPVGLSCFFFCRRSGVNLMRRLQSKRRGLGARAPPVADKESATREKIRSIGWVPLRTRTRRLYFRQGSNLSFSAKNEKDTFRYPFFIEMYRKTPQNFNQPFIDISKQV